MKNSLTVSLILLRGMINFHILSGISSPCSFLVSGLVRKLKTKDNTFNILKRLLYSFKQVDITVVEVMAWD